MRTFRPPRDQCLSELVEPCAEATWRARGEFLRGGTNSSNPSPSSGESTNLGPGGAPVPVRHLDPWGFPLVPATLIGRLAIDRPYYGQRWSNLLFLDTRNRCSRSEAASFAVIVDALADEARNFYIHTAFCS